MTKKSSHVLRLRVFAGPNGSGKSTVIKSVKSTKVKSRKIDFGFYINADDIATLLNKGSYSFSEFHLKNFSGQFFNEIAFASGLIGKSFTREEYLSSFTIKADQILLNNPESVERLAQIIADFLRKRLLAERKKFSFETVFSHPGKLEIMAEAVKAGYKVYLYFISTESPKINLTRVFARVKNGGHNVPPDKIESRYYRSLGLLYHAAQLAYQAFFFDNSSDGEDAALVAHFKRDNGEKKWDDIPNTDKLPNWFIEYYINRIP